METIESCFIEDLGMRLPRPTSKKKYRYWKMRCKSCNSSYEKEMKTIKKFPHLECKECSLKTRSGKLRTVDSMGKNRKLYQAWADMKGRCYNSKSREYVRYGKKGVTVCEEWRDSSKAFISWALTFGDTSKLSLDRVDPYGNYSPENCRWETKSVQAQNIRTIASNNTSGYKGVSFEKIGGTWASKICVNHKHIRIGTYNTSIDAAHAYDRYVRINKLEHTTNFKS